MLIYGLFIRRAGRILSKILSGSSLACTDSNWPWGPKNGLVAKAELCHKGIQEISSSKREAVALNHSFHPETTEKIMGGYGR